MEILKQVKDIHSVSEKEGKLLYLLARRCTGRGVIVEIGSWKGYSTIWLAKGSMDGNKVPIYAVDPHTGSDVHKGMYGEVNTYPIFMENIKKAKALEVVYPMVMTSQKAEKEWGDRFIELLWIDGDHKKAGEDFHIWYPHVMKGGAVALHDTTTWKIPRRVAIEKIYKSYNFTHIGRVGSITFAQKVAGITKEEMIANKIVLWERYLYQAALPSYNRVKIIGAKMLGRI